MKHFTVAFIWLSAAIAQATSIAIVRSPKHIAVAADSRITLYDVEGKERFINGCKILREGNTVFVESGFDLDLENALAREAIKNTKSVAKAAHYFAQHGAGVLGNVLSHGPTAKQDFATFRGRPRVEAFFVGIEADAANVSGDVFILVGDTPQTLKFAAREASCPGHLCKGEEDGQNVWILGRMEELLEFQGRSPRYPATYYPVTHSEEELARHLIEVEEDGRDKYVGGPIDVVTLDATGAHFAKGGSCPAP